MKRIVWLAMLAAALVAALAFGDIRLFGQKRYDAKVGEVISIGHYPQTDSGFDMTPIEWVVLDVQGDKALLISKYVLDSKQYNAEYTDVTWETCSLRGWLNSDFIHKAFDKKEQAAIVATSCDNPDVDWNAIANADGWRPRSELWKGTGCEATEDRLFLLSCDEAGKYFPDNASRMAFPTGQTAWRSYDGQTYEKDLASVWWLRSPGPSDSCAAVVYPDGMRIYAEVAVYGGGVRPAFWVDLKSGIF